MKAILTSLALLAAPLASPVGFAQSDGTLGSSSTGTLNFNVNISDANRVQIFGFGDIVQTIEAGKTGLLIRGNGHRARIVGTGVPGAAIPYPCITSDLPDTTVSLDWSITPLADGANIVPIDFEAGLSRFSTYTEVVPRIFNLTTPQSGSFTGFPATQASTLSPDQRSTCGVPSDTDEKLSFLIYHAAGQTVQTPGTYVSTITITVRPE